MTRNPILRGRARKTFRAVAAAAVPACDSLDESGWSRLEAIVEDALASRPHLVRRQLVLFLRLLDVAALLRHGRRMSSLPAGRARLFLSSLERARVLAIRRGVWGVRTLAFMGYYGRTAAGAELGYRALGGGWEARGAPAGPWTDRDGAAGPEPAVLELLRRSVDDA